MGQFVISDQLFLEVLAKNGVTTGSTSSLLHLGQRRWPGVWCCSTWQPGTLWPAILRQTAHALHCGALRPIETVNESIEDSGVRFLVRRVSSLARKDEERKERTDKAEQRAEVNPFLPYDPDLFVADLSDTHIALLNKFNVIDHHLLIVTRRFEQQEALLTLADFVALFACLAEFGGLAFYNGGAAAGASQRHKHLQIVPLPLGTSGPAVPIEPLLTCARIEGAIGTVPGLPFLHAFARLNSGLCRKV
jgi:ATP adenylyltransferase